MPNGERQLVEDDKVYEEKCWNMFMDDLKAMQKRDIEQASEHERARLTKLVIHDNFLN